MAAEAAAASTAAGTMSNAAGSLLLAMNVLGAGANIIGGIRAKKEAKDAERAAKAATAAAIKSIEVNRMEGVQIPLDAFQLQTTGVLAGQQQAIQALQEGGQRAVIGGVGRVQASGDQGLERIRQAMQQAIMTRDMAVAENQTSIDRSLANINLGRAAGAQERSREQEMIGNLRIQAGAKDLGSSIANFIGNKSLYGNKGGEGLPDPQSVDNISTQSTPEFSIPILSSDSTTNMDRYMQMLAATGGSLGLQKTEF